MGNTHGIFNTEASLPGNGFGSGGGFCHSRLYGGAGGMAAQPVHKLDNRVETNGARYIAGLGRHGL